ncbi:unnamed protein product [Rodentolepis nana]|uniref:Ras-associating domain-containing protein n=1 Tax=Rodentolepis nana TaxID=102285 RepID=A0A0R3TSC3_RODNA|nr:unnamed protein product [Rodentolepis nana]
MGTTYSKCWRFRSKNGESRNYLGKINSSEAFLEEAIVDQGGNEHSDVNSIFQSKTLFHYESPGYSPIFVNVLQNSKLARNDRTMQHVSRFYHLSEDPAPENTKSYRKTNFRSRSSSAFLQHDMHDRTQHHPRPKPYLPIFPYNYGVRMVKEILTKAVENSETINKTNPTMKIYNITYKDDKENNVEGQQIQASAYKTYPAKSLLERSIRKRRVRTLSRTMPRSLSIKKQTKATKIQEKSKVSHRNQAFIIAAKTIVSNRDRSKGNTTRPSRTKPSTETIRKQKPVAKSHQAETSSHVISIDTKQIRSGYSKRQLENERTNSIETPSSTTIMTSKCMAKIPRHTTHAPYKVRLFLKEYETIDNLVTDPDDQRIEIICDRHMCKLDIYDKREIAGYLIYTIDIECETMAWLKECIQDLDAVFGLKIYWQFYAALERKYLS